MAAEGANVLPRLERTGIKAIVLSRGLLFSSGRTEAIALWCMMVALMTTDEEVDAKDMNVVYTRFTRK